MALRSLKAGALLAVIADEDTVTGLLLAGVGDINLKRQSNFLIVNKETTIAQIENAFHGFTAREDIAIILISQYIANDIRHLLDAYTKIYPAVLEIPSKDHPYDPSKDSILRRAKGMFSLD